MVSWPPMQSVVSNLVARTAAVVSLIAIACLPMALRFLHLSEAGINVMISESLGSVADLAAGLGVAVLVAIVAARSTALAIALGVLWVALCFGWYEFQRNFGSPYFLVHALYMTDATFLKGSAVGIAHPLLASFAVAMVVLGALAIRRLGEVRHGLLLSAVALGVIVAPTWMPSTWGEWGAPEWRERNFLVPNLVDVARRTLSQSGSMAALAEADPELDAVFSPDLSGTPLFAFSGKPRNVVLIMIESVAGGSLPSLAAAHGVSSPVKMDRLDQLARDNLSWSTFVTHQRQTNRGEYAALCGDFPKLATAMAKMTEIANGPGKRCLPQALRENGYNTLYLQSANLSFMFKHLFMPKIGFDVSHGESWFDPKYPWGGWGVDDRALYESAIPEIEALDRQDAPWFVTLMTSGTHHPFHFPDDWTGFPDAKKEFRAMQFADIAAADFVEDLRRRGLLEDTVVLITSDEASFVNEIDSAKSDRIGKFTANWGYLIAITPEGARGRIDTPVQQSDLTLSVLDYLGLASAEDPFIGRSLFRRYDGARKIFFANLYDRVAGSYEIGGFLELCDENLTGCERFAVPEDRLFSAAIHSEGEAEPSSLLRAVQARSLRPALPGPVGSPVH